MNETPRPLIVWAITPTGRPVVDGPNASSSAAIVVAVDFANLEPERRELVGEWIEGVRALGAIALLQAVAVDDDSEVVEAGVAGGHQRLPVAAFLQLAVADDHEHARGGDRASVARCAAPTA